MDYYESYFSDLPMEILLQIFNYLSPTDLRAAGLACTRWHQATQHHSFLDKQIIHFYKIHFAHDMPPINRFLNSCNEFPNIVLELVDFGGRYESFWEQNKTKFVSFKSCDIREKIFCTILQNLKSLETLKIEKCRELFMSGRLFDSDLAIDEKEIVFPKLKALGVTHNRYLSDAIFNRFIAMAPQLQSLDMTGTHISFHKGLYKKFYPKSQMEPSESVLTFHFISQFIENQASKLNSLNFSETLIDGTALSTLSCVADLNLDRLELVSCDQLTNDGIKNLVRKQINLTYLDISKSVRLTDASLMEICSTLQNLTTLKLRKCRAITDMGVKEISNLKKLKSLDISECENLTGQSVLNGVAKEQNFVYEEIFLSALNICEKSVLKIVENFPNLKVLDLSCCFNSVTELVVQMIFKHLIWLRELNLDYCEQVSDAALTGMSMTQKCREYENTKNNSDDANNKRRLIENNEDNIVVREHPVQIIDRLMNNNHIGRRDPCKISLRSRAEEEIVRDAKQKELIKTICEQNILKADWSGYSIKNLKGLRSLHLMSCNKVTDISLQYGFKFPELQQLSLSKCQQISVEGIKDLVKNCPAIEVLDLSECHNLNDKSIDLITVHLPRLTHLYIERCNQLTDFSLDSIAVNCTTIKCVDIRGCRAMCPEPGLRLSSVQTLRDISMSKPGPYVTPILINSIKSRPKPPPFPF